MFKHFVIDTIMLFNKGPFSLLNLRNKNNNFSPLQYHKVNMSHIESRPSRRSKSEYDFYVDCEELQGPKLTKFVEALKGQALSITLHSEDGGGNV